MFRAASLVKASVAALLPINYLVHQYRNNVGIVNCDSDKGNHSSNTQVHSKNYKKRYVYIPPVDEEQVEIEQDPHIAIFSGSSNPELAQKVSRYLNRGLSTIEIRKFSDGEIFIDIKESLRGKDVYIIQTCSPPVNDSVMELLLSIAAAKRSGATRVTAVIPYLGYRLNRRGLPISTTHNTRFLWNAAIDLAKMLHVAGADKVISMDLQRPGQGHEACFFPTYLPAETITSNDTFVRYFTDILNPETPVVVVSPNVEFTKKAKKFETKLKQISDLDVSQGLFLRTDADAPTQKGTTLDFKGDVKGADVILIEDYVDSAVNLSVMCNRLMKEGAKRVFVCASHGHFTPHALEILELSPITQVVISDSIAHTRRALAADNSSITTGRQMDLESLDYSTPTTLSITDKLIQVSIAPLLARIIQSDIEASLKNNHLYISGHWNQDSKSSKNKNKKHVRHYTYAVDEATVIKGNEPKRTETSSNKEDDEEFVDDQ